MAEITLEKLKQYAAMQSEKKQIEDQIDALYRSISSPRLGESLGSTELGNPTERTAFRIIEEKERLEQLSIELWQMTKEIEDWLLSLDDHEIRAVVRAHYINGKTWRQTAKEVMGYFDSDAAKKKIYRYFK